MRIFALSPKLKENLRLKLGEIANALGIINPPLAMIKAQQDFITNNFGHNTISEVCLAFELYAAGKLDTDTEPYGSFSLPFTGKVLTAYREYSQPIIKQKEIEQKLIEQAPFVHPPEDEFNKQMHEVILTQINQHRKLPFIANWSAAYKYLVNCGEIMLTIEDKRAIAAKFKPKLMEEIFKLKARGEKTNIDEKKMLADLCSESVAKEYYIEKYLQVKNKV